MPTDRITTERRKPVNLLLNRPLLSKRPFHCIKRNRIQTTGAAMNFVLLAIFFFPLAFAQFGHFFQQGFPFGGGFQQQQQQQEQQAPGRQHKGWTESERVHCRAGYVCPASLACVPTPADCPCPYPEDIKCVVPDNRPRDEGEGPPFFCVRGDTGCAQVLEFSKPI